jgi:3',5'-cyclic AMP phosphodiesterase CpdA
MPKSNPRIYNLCWYSQRAGTKDKPAQGVRHNKLTISEQKQIGVVILYPALATPEILVGDTDKLELLLLTQKSEDLDKFRMRIQNQLKISLGLEPDKKVNDRSLFVDEAGNLVGTPAERTIDVDEIPFSAKKLMETHFKRFSGYIDKRAYKIYADAGYKTLYRVALSSKVLESAMGNRILSARGEPQDLIIKKMLDKRSSWAKQKDGEYYCFALGGDDLDHTAFNTEEPIQSYHPVFHYSQNDLVYANFGHLTDVHLAARQQVLAKSIARVIDVWDMGFDQELPSSPRIGKMINICSQDMIQIMSKLSDGADMLLIGGDLVDFLRSCYLSRAIADDLNFRSGIPWKIWETVALDKSYTDRYKDAADMIGFFTLLLTYCRKHKSPAYAVSGNHDCYHLPYGLSPRLGPKRAERRANEGIPSDHNLTFYEAILVFGETYRELKSGLSSPFNKDMFDWFYMVFTPFTDFGVELPNQHLVAGGWGDDENIFDIPGTGHGFGHLPRSTDGFSDEQLGILTTAIGKQKRIILMTHFTFVSYDYSIPVNIGESEKGDIYISKLKNYGKYNFGTFEENRATLFKTHCFDNRDIQIILTGHSHRRALYLVDDFDPSIPKRIKTLHYDFSSFHELKKSYPKQKLQPAIVVSDSGGTIPRYNLGGEFNGRGSDPPSGTTILFDQSTGDLSHVYRQTADVYPRVAVGVDYLDIQEKKTVVVHFASEPFSVEDEKTRTLTDITFKIELVTDLVNSGFWVEALSFFVLTGVSDPWRMITLEGSDLRQTPGGTRYFAIKGKHDVRIFSKYFAKNIGRGNFLSMKFGKPAQGDLPRYEFNTPWCWEFQVDFETSEGGTKKVYKILRDKKRAEIPDFDWRRTNMPGKYKHK